MDSNEKVVISRGDFERGVENYIHYGDYDIAWSQLMEAEKSRPTEDASTYGPDGSDSGDDNSALSHRSEREHLLHVALGGMRAFAQLVAMEMEASVKATECGDRT